MTVSYCAIKLGRKGVGIELNGKYWLDGAENCAAAEGVLSMPSLFDVLELQVIDDRALSEAA